MDEKGCFGRIVTVGLLLLLLLEGGFNLRQTSVHDVEDYRLIDGGGGYSYSQCRGGGNVWGQCRVCLCRCCVLFHHRSSVAGRLGLDDDDGIDERVVGGGLVCCWCVVYVLVWFQATTITIPKLVKMLIRQRCAPN